MSGSTASAPGAAANAHGWHALARDAAGRRGADLASPDAMRRLLCFTIGGTPYAVPVESVREIVRMRPLTPVPRVAAAVRGVISLRGEIIQVVDLRLRLGLSSAEPGRATRIVVVHTDSGRVAGVWVDAVREVLAVPESEIDASPAAEAARLVCALCRRGEEFVSLVDVERVLEVDADV